MAHVNRRIGKSSETAITTTDGTGGGVLDAFLHDYFQRSGNVYNAPGAPGTGMQATGGVISDYNDGGTIYRAHIFTSTGDFDVTSLSTDPNIPSNIDYLMVAGGGGGGGGSPGSYTSGGVGGGGAGGLLTASSQPVSVQSYPIVIGAGGVGGTGRSGSAGDTGGTGGNTTFYSLTAYGGGGGGKHHTVGANGGSGGGGGAGGSGTEKAGGSSPYNPPQGNAGGHAWTSPGSPPGIYQGGGGGGAGEAGKPGDPSDAPPDWGFGGAGTASVYAEGPGNPITYAGGGGGGLNHSSGDGAYAARSGGTGGGGAGSIRNPPGGISDDAISGTAGLGGGGGGANVVSSGINPILFGANGGSGTVVVRYKIASVSTAKATGGAISFYGGKTIHTFTNSGTFATTSEASVTSVSRVPKPSI